MATNNAINAPLPISATNGGTGLSNPTIHGILVGEATSPVNPIVLTAGQLLIGTTASDPVGATLTAGTGIAISSVSGAITISASGIDSFVWNNVTGTSQAMTVNQGYIANNAGLVTMTLPATAAIGTILGVAGNGAGGWSIAQNALQNIQIGSASSTAGTGGSVSSSNRYDSVNLLCTVANTTWVSVGGPEGNLTIV